MSLWPFLKCRLTNLRNCFPTLHFTLSEYGGLNQIIFHFRLFFFSLPCLSTSFLTYSSFSWNPLFFSASSYMGIDSLNICSLEDVSEILLLTDLLRWHFPKGISMRYLIKIPFKSAIVVWEVWAPSWQAATERFYQRMKSYMNATVEIKMIVL